MKKSPLLSIPDFGEWLVAVFEHEVPANDEEPSWYFEDGLEITIDQPSILIRHVTRLCTELDRIGKSFSLEQVDQGFWLLLGPKLELGMRLVDESIDPAERLTCIAAMPAAYAKFVSC